MMMTNTRRGGSRDELPGFVRSASRLSATEPLVFYEQCLRCVCFRPLPNVRHRHSVRRDVATLRFPIKSSFH